MRESSSKKRAVFRIICCLGITLFFNSCNKDDTPPDCGCYSETRNTIFESDNLIGEMYYETQSDNPLDTYYNNFYWIKYTGENSSNSIRSMIVCNEDFMNNEFDYIKITGEVVEVKFSGHLKSVCDRRNNPAIYTFNRIIITSIEQQ